eukprot:GEMP01004236.1.p1 GENE.GEMP01004236.1~~GEMP01004236.1.p1  ORF type:complete len:583 (+),score=87.56 GEMP01004236.1:133-1881(+)
MNNRAQTKRMVAIIVWAALAGVTFAKEFCGNPQYKTLTERGIDTTQLAEASALVLSSDRKRFYMFSDSPEENAFIFVHSAVTGLFIGRIDIVGVTNPHYNGGYGDWEAGVIKSCEHNPSMMCIVVGDIGHNCIRMDRGMYRMPNQPTRIIEVPEPRPETLSKNRPIKIAGIEYHFRYPNGWLFDAEAMVIDNENRLLLITKNTAREYPYAHILKFPALSRNSVVTLEHLAIVMVEFSEVTDATNTGEYLALRTYVGINFYAWHRLHEPALRASSGFFSMQWLRDRGELHEGFCFDYATNIFYFVAEGATRITYLSCPPANPEGAIPRLTRDPAALGNFGHRANPWNFQKGLKDKMCYKKSHERAQGSPPSDPKGKKGKHPEKGKGRDSEKGKGRPSDKTQGKGTPKATSPKGGTLRPSWQLGGKSPRDDQCGRGSSKRTDSRSPNSGRGGTPQSGKGGSPQSGKGGTPTRHSDARGSKKQSLLCIGDDYGQWSGRDSDDREHWRGRGEEGYDSNRRWQEDENPVLKRKVTRRRRKNKFAWSKTRLRSRERKKGNILWQKRQKEEMHGGIGLPLRKTAFFHFC